MDFKPLTLAELGSQHTEYTALAPIWRTLETLREGFPAIKANVGKYLPKRPAEDDDLYKLRTAKLAYSPVMSHVVHTYTGKMAMAGVDFPEDVDLIWQDLRDSNASPVDVKRDEATFLSELLTNILFFGRAHILTDVPKEAAELRSNFELKRSKLLPYFTTLHPLDLINWGTGWACLKQFVSEAEPFQSAKTFAVYTYLGEEVTCKYKVPVKLANAEDSEGNLVPTVDKVYYKGEWVKPDDKQLWSPDPPVYGAGIDRLVSKVVSSEKWLCLALYNKQIQHLRIENSWTDAGYLSGTVQRVFTPADPAPNDDPRISVDTSAVAKQLEKAGNQHILIGKGYSFVESSGTALANLEQMLDKIESQIAKIANLSFVSGDATALQQSGVSKALDMSLLNGTLAEYGNILIDTYNTLLAKVAKLLAVQPIEVSGLSDFTEEDPLEMLATIVEVAKIADFPVKGRLALYLALLGQLGVVVEDSDTSTTIAD